MPGSLLWKGSPLFSVLWEGKRLRGSRWATPEDREADQLGASQQAEAGLSQTQGPRKPDAWASAVRDTASPQPCPVTLEGLRPPLPSAGQGPKARD